MNEAAVPCAGKGTPRAEAQRDRILAAALRCFIERGFHGASMANISDAAQMSAGLVYRYFENKDAIVRAIVERGLEERRSGIRKLQSSEQFAARLVDVFREWGSRDPAAHNVALLLEISAEATRNPPVAQALREADAAMRAEFRSWLERAPGEGGLGLAPEAAATRSLVLQCMVEGLAVRAAREPNLDPAQLREALDDLFEHLLR